MAAPGFRLSFLHPRYWPQWLGFALLWLLAQLPYSVLLRLGRGLGALAYCLAHSRRRIVQRNLKLCFPELDADAREHLAKQNFASTGIAIFEMAISWWWPLSRLRRLGHIEGLEQLRQARQQGQGVILLAAHFTTLEIGAALLGGQHSIDGMYRTHNNPLFDWLQRKGRERHNAESLAVARDDVRGALRLLRQGRALWYAPDQDYGRKHSLFAPLFGVTAATVTATSSFAKLGRARVLPFTQERLSDGSGYRLIIHPPFNDFPGQSVQADCLRINQWLEHVIRRHPEQYLWAHRRFKTRPEGEPPLYI